MCEKASQNVVELNFELPVREVLRAMGCGQHGVLRPHIQQTVDHVIHEWSHLIQARGTYRIYDVARMTDTELELEGCPVICGPIAAFLRPATRVAAFVVTVGSELEKLATERMNQGQMLEGYTLNALGSSAADAAADALADQVYWNHASSDEGITPPFSPGYCGMSLDQQRTLFSIVDGGNVGVRLLPTMIMEPVKSVSGLLGIGPRDLIVERGVPCQWCELETCKMRR